MHSRSLFGRTGEEIVAKKLETAGFAILHKNYAQRCGEIDLIASKEDLLLFIEVKMRKDPKFDLEYLITPCKQKKIISVAKQYMAKHNICDKVCRFDVALIEGTITNHKITYIPNAFCDQDEFQGE